MHDPSVHFLQGAMNCGLAVRHYRGRGRAVSREDAGVWSIDLLDFNPAALVTPGASAAESLPGRTFHWRGGSIEFTSGRKNLPLASLTERQTLIPLGFALWPPKALAGNLPLTSAFITGNSTSWYPRNEGASYKQAV